MKHFDADYTLKCIDLATSERSIADRPRAVLYKADGYTKTRKSHLERYMDELPTNFSLLAMHLPYCKPT
jgi:hypothetical protein